MQSSHVRNSKLYFISGLGADKRVFANLNVNHPFQNHIVWEIPFKNETMKAYCQRLLAQVDQNAEIILIGLSFGGIIAQEIAKLIPVKKIIIISSIKNEKEKSWTLRLAGKMKLNKATPFAVSKFLNKLTADYYFGTKSKEESGLLQKIIDDTNPVFSEWAIDQILKWENINDKDPIHIHGTDDKIFPASLIKNYIPIKDGGHFMVYNKADEISFLINECLF
jgi:pimeloyl-ACP methyl ester carboxylesterase